MLVNFEFLGEEPIENVITAMHFRTDATILFGYEEIIKKQKESLEYFLCTVCNIGKVRFYQLEHSDIQSIISVMKNIIDEEIAQDNDLFFDLTGGADLILVAFGILSKEYSLPMHLFDIPGDRIIDLNTNHCKCISDLVPHNEVHLNIDKYIRLYGGRINTNLQKEIKTDGDDEFEKDILKICNIMQTYSDIWNAFSSFIHEYLYSSESLRALCNADTILKSLSESKTKLRTVKQLNSAIDDLGKEGILSNIVHADGLYEFFYKNNQVRDCLIEGGSILELYIYNSLKDECDDCRVGVHVDWDGLIHEIPGKDVTNEIDVITLNGNIPTFISCKSGRMGPQQVLHALYELDTVADTFGGKYARRKLVTLNPIEGIYLERAREMNIEVIQCINNS